MGRAKSFRRSAAGWIIRLLLFGILLYLLLHYVGQRTAVIGASMEPALSRGDQLLVDKLSYRLWEPERFDIIVFHKEEKDFFYIKRIIALPGESIWISREGDIYINDRLLEEDYGMEAISYAGLAGSQLTLGMDEYFVLGDNRNESEDSRYETVGMVKRSEITGRAAFRIYPLPVFGSLRDR